MGMFPTPTAAVMETYHLTGNPTPGANTTPLSKADYVTDTYPWIIKCFKGPVDPSFAKMGP